MSFPRDQRAQDFWRVNSYGYPSPFAGDKGENAWTTLLSFFDYSDYGELKAYWSSKSAPWQLSSHAVESWKATFEEFGLVWVESRSNHIVTTPAGGQLRTAGELHNAQEFAWIGLNLLLRYPLRGPRRAKSPAHANSDLLLYRFWYAALLDLDGYLWWSEFERILCRVFQTEQASAAVEDIRELRSNPQLLGGVSLPAARRPGGFYNSLNQVVVHASINHLLMSAANESSPYGVTEPPRLQRVRGDWSEMIRRAMNAGGGSLCGSGGAAVMRLPSAPDFGSEADYFDYMGATVSAFAAGAALGIETIELQGELVWLLEEGIHFVRSEGGIVGSVQTLCQLAVGQRVLLSSDERWSYLVIGKHLVTHDEVFVGLRQARPISSMAVVREMKGQWNV